MYTIVGLGNPGNEYERTRHNVGRMAVEALHVSLGMSPWDVGAKKKGLVAEGVIGKHDVTLLLPETYMNKSGTAVKELVTGPKKAEKLIVVYDEIDLPLGTIRIAKNRGSGGHRGIDSITKSLNTKDFIRIRVGVAPVSFFGKIKKPKGEKKVVDFLMGTITSREEKAFEEVFTRTTKAIETIVREGVTKAMNTYNQ